MRNVDRIGPFVKQLGYYWKTCFPDWRFGQLVSNFMGWLYNNKHIDIFFVEEDQLLLLLEEFVTGEEGGEKWKS